ncbi:ATP-binding cassette domain-containing protein [Niabella terrae]
MIHIHDLHFAYRKKKVFDGLSLSFSPGHIYGLLGKNGTGKSTLLKNIVGALFPQRGTLSVLGQTPAKRSPRLLQELFILPEEFYLPDVSIEKYLNGNAPFYPRFNREQFHSYLQEFEIPLRHRLQQMSYGQKKKVLISFALACNTSVLLMDEPSNGLDIMSKSQFRKVIAGAIDADKCFIISTHQVKDLESLIDRITIIDEGKILFDQPIGQISSRLDFSYAYEGQSTEDILYREQSLKGHAVISRNPTGREGHIDLELLYKAVVTNGEALKALFNHPAKN